MMSFSYRERYLPCESCGAPTPVASEGVTTQCPRCGASLIAPARPETSVPASPPSNELQRRERLRVQDGRPLLPPPGLEQVAPGGTIEQWKLAEARMVWSATRRQLAVQPADVGAAERLVWLTMAFMNTMVGSGDETAMRAMIEGALEVLMLPRHRQTMRGYLARFAAKSGDLQSAEAWLAGCDPNSDDLQTDSVYRVSRAYIDTASGNCQAVLQVLGSNEQEVPIMDAMDPIATVLRANAWERMGQVEAARALLARFMTSSGGMSNVVEHVVAALPPHWQVCAQSMQLAQAAVRQQVGARAASGGGGAIFGYVFMAAGMIPLIILVAMAASGTFMPQMLFMLIFPLVFGGIGLKAVLGARRAQEIARDGLRGKGRIIALNMTGTRINNVPLMEIVTQVEVQGYPPTQCTTRRLMYPHQAGGLQGREVAVIWHPKYPSQVVLEI